MLLVKENSRTSVKLLFNTSVSPPSRTMSLTKLWKQTILVIIWSSSRGRNRKITTLNGTLARTEGEIETECSFRRTSRSRRCNYSWKSRASLLPISNQKESHLILQNHARTDTHTNTDTVEDGCTLPYVDSVKNFQTTETKPSGKIRE